MAVIHIPRADVESGNLPQVCACCEAPGTVHIRRRFAWHSPWMSLVLILGFLLFVVMIVPALILVIVMTKRMTMEVSLCQRHRNHWRWRSRVLLWSFVGIVLLVVGGFFLGEYLSRKVGGFDILPWFCIGTAVLAVAWGALMAILDTSAIHAIEITDDSITLTGVSLAFVQEFLTREEEIDRPQVYWYAAIQGRVEGPMLLEALRQLAASGRLQAADSVCLAGQQTWTPAGQVQQLW